MAILGKRLTITPRRVGSLQSADPGATNAAPRGTISLDNILKLIPGDVISLFMAGAGLQAVVRGGAPDSLGNTQSAVNMAMSASTSAPSGQLPANWADITFWVCFLVCALLRIAATRPAGEGTFSLKGVNWSLLCATLVAFYIWAHAVSPAAVVGPGWFYGGVAGFFALVFGIVAPLFVKAG